MIKQGFIYYFKNLKYVFTIIGTLSLGVAFGLAALLPGISNAINKMLTTISETLNYFDFNADGFKSKIFSSIQTLDWSNPTVALKTAMSSEWLIGTIRDCAQEVFPNAEECAALIEQSILTCVHEMIFCVVVFFVYVILGLICGYVLVRWLVRRNMAKRAFWKMFVNYFMNAVFNGSIIVFGVWLDSIWNGWAVIPSLVIMVLYGVAAIFEAYVIHGFGKIKMEQALNFKNILQLLVTDILILLTAFAFWGLFLYLTNGLVGLLLGIAFIEIALIVISLLAEAYVKDTVEVNVTKSVSEQKQDKQNGNEQQRVQGE